MAELETSVVTDVLLPIVLAVMMFGMGLATPARLFGQVAARPRGLLLGPARSPAFYSLVMFATGGLLAWYWARRPVA